MNKKTILPSLLLLLCMTASPQHRYTVAEVPNVQLEDHTRYVSDPEAVLGINDRLILDEMAAELRDSLGVETAIVLLPYIDTGRYGSAREFAHELFNSWGIGDKETNRGLLILLLTGEGEREIVFETGYGIEETLTDGLCKVIQNKKMVPFLKESAFGEGLTVGMQEIKKVFDSTSDLLEDSDKWTSKSTKELLAFLGIWTLIGLIVYTLIHFVQKKKADETTQTSYRALVSAKSESSAIGCLAVLFLPAFILWRIFMGSPSRKINKGIICEKCGAAGSMKMDRTPRIIQQAVEGQNGIKRYTFTCAKCGAMHHEDLHYKFVPKTSDSSSSGNRSWSSGSSGGSWGGSWGGGSSGGGGASTRF